MALRNIDGLRGFFASFLCDIFHVYKLLTHYTRAMYIHIGV